MSKKNKKPQEQTKKIFFNKPSDEEQKNILPLEVKGILLLGLNLITFLSLITYTEGEQSNNSLGLMGGAIAYSLQFALGLGSYLLLIFLTYFAWKLLTSKNFPSPKATLGYFFLMLFSVCMLLNVLADYSPPLAAFFRPMVVTNYTLMQSHAPYTVARDNLGGVPLYYIFTDLPEANLKRVLGNLGTTIIFMTTLSISAFLLCNASLSNFLDLFNGFTLPSPKKLLQTSSFLKNISFSMLSRRKQGDQPATPTQAVAKPPTLAHTPPTPTPSFQPNSLPSIKTEIYNHSQEEKKVPQEEAISPVSGETPFNKPLSPKQAAQLQQTVKEAAISAQRVYNGDFTNYKLPPSDLLTTVKHANQENLKSKIQEQAVVLEQTLASFGLEAKVGDIHCGPTITSFEVHPAAGVKVQKITALESDLALNMRAKSIRIIAPIPGKAAVGIEVPNPFPQEVGFKDMLDGYHKKAKRYQIPVLLGKTVSGEHVQADLAKMPHCIIAGATGSGKSVCINTIIMSILMNARPDEIKLLLVDPKKVELTPYNHLPHMIAPVITEPQGAYTALNWLVKEMENRYEIFKQLGVRNIHSFNERKPNEELEASLRIEIPKKMHFIVAIIDELADLMMVSNCDIEAPIARIAQMARAVGIHLILATQRPSREVITGVIKANFPARIAFKVASRINSQIILDETGAESLLGNGDMLFLPPGTASFYRAQGAFIRDQDIHKVIEFICNQAPSHYMIPSFDHLSEEYQSSIAPSNSPSNGERQQDALYDKAKQLVIETQNASTTFLQRKLKVGYARAASLTDQLEEDNIISALEGSKGRRVLVQPDGLLDDEDD